MFEYFKRLFNEMIVQSRQSVGRNVQPIRRERTDARRSVDLGSSFSRKLGRSERDNKSFWSQESLLDILDEEAMYINRTILRCCAQKNDPYKKKKRDDNATSNGKKMEDDKSYSSTMCDCENCSIISGINECGICLESLQNRGVRCCKVCSNIICSECEQKLSHCPFCRTSQKMQVNEAIERLLDRLFLPCRNARHGCGIILNSDTRKKHENNCIYNLIDCPLGYGCGWSGTSQQASRHLDKAHGLKPREDRGLLVEIANFRRNTKKGEGEYTIYLLHQGRLFTIKYMLRRRTLTVSLIEMSNTNKAKEDPCQKNYGVELNVIAGRKYFRGFVPILKFVDDTRQIDIDCRTFPPIPGRFPSNDGTLKIEIGITELDYDSD